MSDIKDWADDADLNGEASPAGWPEGMPPSDVNNSAREMMAALRRSYVRQPWYAPGGEIVRVSGTQITIKDDTKVTDYSQFYTVGQRFRVEGVEYNTTGFISSVSYEAPTTTIGFEADAEALLPGTIKEVYVGLNYQDVQGVAGPNLLGCIIGFTEESSKIGAGLLHANGEKFSPSLYPDLAALYLIGTESDGSPKYRYGREKVGDAWWPKRPDVRGYFPRFLDNREAPAEGEDDTRVDLEAPRTVGSIQEDAIVSITGKFPSGEGNTAITEGGPFYRLDETYGISGGRDAKYRKGIGFDLSKATRTAPETRPKNIAVVGVIVAYGGVVAGGLADISEVLDDVKLAKDLAQQTAATVESLGSVMRYCGSVATYAALPTDENEVGDVYNVLDTGVNYAWTDSGTWDEFGGVIPDNVLLNNASVDTALAIGKGASASHTAAIAVGNGASASGTYSLAIGGWNTKAVNASSTAVGNSAQALDNEATALGYGSRALAAGSIAIGGGNIDNTADHAIVIGRNREYVTEPNTMHIAFNGTSYKMLDADGKIPVERLPEDIGGGASSLEDIAVAGEGIMFTNPVVKNNIASADINGSPTISTEGIITNMSSSNYLKLDADSIPGWSGSLFTGNYSWAWTVKFKTPSDITQGLTVFRLGNSLTSFNIWCAVSETSSNAPGRVAMGIHLSDNTWSNGSLHQPGTTVLKNDSLYYLRLSREVSTNTYALELSEDEEHWNTEISFVSSLGLFNTYATMYVSSLFGNGAGPNEYDLKGFKFTSNYGSGIDWTAYEYSADKTEISANVDLTGYLKNTSTRGAGLQIKGNDSNAKITVDDTQIVIGAGSYASANSTNTGSVAIGFDAKTTDFYSVAIGNDATAKGGVAIGDDATTTGGASIALCGTADYGAVSIGKYSQSASYGVSIGYSAISSGTDSLAIGNSATTSYQKAVALGASTSVTGDYGIAIGAASQSAASGMAIGWQAKASGTGSTAIGTGFSSQPTTASGNYSVAIGRGNTASGLSSLALGHGAVANAERCIQLGKGTNETARSLAVGFEGSGSYSLLTSDGKIPGARMSLQGTTAPTTSTAGSIGQFYVDTATGTGYMCVGASSGTYTWKQITS